MYYNPNIIIKMLKNSLNESYYEINDFVNKASVKLKEKDIKKFLEDKYLESHPKIKEEKERLKNKKDIDSETKKFAINLEYGKYKYEPYTLEYFNKYIEILKKKCINLIKIIDGITEETISKDVLKELDINLDENGNILMFDVLRLTEPFIYNYNELKKMVERANNLNTYLEFKLSLDYVYRNGFSENELYPLEKLQDEHEEMFSKSKEGYIPLTEKQKELLRKIDEENTKSMCDLIKSL